MALSIFSSLVIRLMFKMFIRVPVRDSYYRVNMKETEIAAAGAACGVWAAELTALTSTAWRINLV